VPDDAALGAFLRQRREAKAFSLDDLATATRIRPRYLSALEEDRLADLPAPMFVRGHLRAYCAPVGEPAGYALSLYAARVRGLADTPPVPPPRPAAMGWRPARPVLIAAALLLVLGGALPLFASAPAAHEERGVSEVSR
jgi:cytoskeleton protein RodZ